MSWQDRVIGAYFLYCLTVVLVVTPIVHYTMGDEFIGEIWATMVIIPMTWMLGIMIRECVTAVITGEF